MGLKFNPITGNLDIVGGGGDGLYKYKVERFTLSAGDITNKYVVLTDAPTNKPNTRLVVIEGIEQDYSVDFQVTADDSNKRLSWDSLGLESILQSGDKLVIAYD